MTCIIIVGIPQPCPSQRVTSCSEVTVPYISSCKDSCIGWWLIDITKVSESSCQEGTVIFMSMAFPFTSRHYIWYNPDPKSSHIGKVSKVDVVHNFLHLPDRIIVAANHHIPILIRNTSVSNISHCLETIWINGSSIIQGIDANADPSNISVIVQTFKSGMGKWTNQIHYVSGEAKTKKYSENDQTKHHVFHFAALYKILLQELDFINNKYCQKLLSGFKWVLQYFFVSILEIIKNQHELDGEIDANMILKSETASTKSLCSDSGQLNTISLEDIQQKIFQRNQTN